MAEAGDFEKKRPVAASSDDLRQPPKTNQPQTYINRGCSFPDALRAWSFDPRDSGANQRRKGGRLGRIDGAKRCFGKMWNGRNPFSNKGKKKTRHPGEWPRRDGFVFTKWWRWRESNPRPQALRSRYYMLVLSIILVVHYPTGREDTRRVRFLF